MAKTTAPLLSFGAAGAIAKVQVYSRWRGIPYARQYVTPSNPNTTAQQLTRNIFRTLNSMWLVAPSLLIAPYDRNAEGQSFLGRNKFIGDNLRTMRGEANMQLFAASPGAKGGLPANSIAVTPGAGTLTVDFDVPAAPAGWTLDGAVALAFPDQAPDEPFAGPITADEDAAAPYSVVLSGLTAGVLYQVSGYLRWTKADGKVAYGASLQATGTPA